MVGNGIDWNGECSCKSVKLCRGKKWAKVNNVHGAACSWLDNDSVHDSGIENQNMIIRTEANDTMSDCKVSCMTFNELDNVVVEEVSSMIREE